MKSLKVLSLFFALFIIGINSSYAQSKADNLTEEQKEEIKKNLEEHAAALNLSEDQKAKFEAITKKYAEQMKAVMKTILSKDQYKVYLEKQEEMKDKMKQRRG